MTAFVDFRFTAASGWTDSANALSDKVAGSASSGSIASGNDTPSLLLTSPVVTWPDDGTDPAITGIELELWLTHNSASTSTRTIDIGQLTGGLGITTNLGSGVDFGERRTQETYLPRTATVLGGQTNLWGLPSVTLDQFTTGLQFELVGTNAGGKSCTFLAWDVKGRLWLDILSMQDVVERAYRRANILSKDTEIEAVDLAHGLDLLNDMMHGWAAFGIDISHVDRVAGEAFPIARKFVEGTAMQLATRLSQDYQVAPVASDRFFASLHREYNPDDRTDRRDTDDDGVVSDAEAEAGERARYF